MERRSRILIRMIVEGHVVQGLAPLCRPVDAVTENIAEGLDRPGKNDVTVRPGCVSRSWRGLATGAEVIAADSAPPTWFTAEIL